MCSILNESLASEIVENSTLAHWMMTAPTQELKTFANEPINVMEMIQAPIASNGWRIEDAEFVVLKDGLKPLPGRDLFEALGISVTQTPYSYERSTVINVTIQCPFKTRIANQFPQLITRIIRSKIHIVKSKFHKNLQPKHQRVEEYPLIYKNQLIVKLKNFLKKDT